MLTNSSAEFNTLAKNKYVGIPAAMKQFLFVSVVVVLAFVFNSSAFALSYPLDAQACLDGLVWNSTFTEAHCKVRNGQTSDNKGSRAVNFAFPNIWGMPRIEGFIRQLADGYILTIRAESPLVPDQILPQLKWILEANDQSGRIEKPEGICESLLAEAKALFVKPTYIFSYADD